MNYKCIDCYLFRNCIHNKYDMCEFLTEDDYYDTIDYFEEIDWED